MWIGRLLQSLVVAGRNEFFRASVLVWEVTYVSLLQKLYWDLSRFWSGSILCIIGDARWLILYIICSFCLSRLVCSVSHWTSYSSLWIVRHFAPSTVRAPSRCMNSNFFLLFHAIIPDFTAVLDHWFNMGGVESLQAFPIQFVHVAMHYVWSHFCPCGSFHLPSLCSLMPSCLWGVFSLVMETFILISGVSTTLLRENVRATVLLGLNLTNLVFAHSVIHMRLASNKPVLHLAARTEIAGLQQYK